MGNFLSALFGAFATRFGRGRRAPGAETALDADAGGLWFAARLTGAEGQGNILLSFDPATRMLSWMAEYAELEGPPVRAYFSVAETEAEGAPDPHRLMLPGSLASPISGAARLTARQSADLTAGNWSFTLEAADDRLQGVLRPAKG